MSKIGNVKNWEMSKIGKFQKKVKNWECRKLGMLKIINLEN